MALLNLEDAVVVGGKAKLLDGFKELRLAKLGIAPETDETGVPRTFFKHLTVVMLTHDVAVVGLCVRVVSKLFTGLVELNGPSVTTFLDDKSNIAVFPRTVDKARLVDVPAFTFDVCYAIRNFAVYLRKTGRTVGMGVWLRKEVRLVDVLGVHLLVEPNEALQVGSALLSNFKTPNCVVDFRRERKVWLKAFRVVKCKAATLSRAKVIAVLLYWCLFRHLYVFPQRFVRCPHGGNNKGPPCSI